MDLCDIRVQLCHENYWRRLNKVVNAVRVDKEGRRIFPSLKYFVHGLVPEARYSVHLCFQRVDNFTYVFRNGTYERKEGSDDINPIIRTLPAVTLRGKLWMNYGIEFNRLVLNNQPSTKSNEVTLNSHCKYVPILEIQKVGHSRRCQFRISFTEFLALTTVRKHPSQRLRLQLKREMNSGKWAKPTTMFAPVILHPVEPPFAYPGIFPTLPLQEVTVPPLASWIFRRKSDFSINAILGLDEENENQENMTPMKNDDVVVNVVD